MIQFPQANKHLQPNLESSSLELLPDTIVHLPITQLTDCIVLQAGCRREESTPILHITPALSTQAAKRELITPIAHDTLTENEDVVLPTLAKTEQCQKEIAGGVEGCFYVPPP